MQQSFEIHRRCQVQWPVLENYQRLPKAIKEPKSVYNQSRRQRPHHSPICQTHQHTVWPHQQSQPWKVGASRLHTKSKVTPKPHNYRMMWAWAGLAGKWFIFKISFEISLKQFYFCVWQHTRWQLEFVFWFENFVWSAIESHVRFCIDNATYRH